MKFFIALLTLVSSFAAVSAEQDVSYSYNGWQGGSTTYYACDFVESLTKKNLKALGVTDIQVRCSGGIDRNMPPMPVSVRASFNLPAVTGSSTETVVVKGDRFNPNCGLNVKMMESFLKVLPHVTVVSKSTRCSFDRSQWSYELNIAR